MYLNVAFCPRGVEEETRQDAKQNKIRHKAMEWGRRNLAGFRFLSHYTPFLPQGMAQAAHAFVTLALLAFVATCQAFPVLTSETIFTPRQILRNPKSGFVQVVCRSVGVFSVVCLPVCLVWSGLNWSGLVWSGLSLSPSLSLILSTWSSLPACLSVCLAYLSLCLFCRTLYCLCLRHVYALFLLPLLTPLVVFPSPTWSSNVLSSQFSTSPHGRETQASKIDPCFHCIGGRASQCVDVLLVS